MGLSAFVANVEASKWDGVPANLKINNEVNVNSKRDGFGYSRLSNEVSTGQFNLATAEQFSSHHVRL